MPDPTERDEKHRPCGTCPWRPENHGAENPEGWEETNQQIQEEHGESLEDWYSEENLRRLWEGLRTGRAPGMICHATDPNADDYGGDPAKEGHERYCTGALILQMRHLKLMEAVLEIYDGDQADTCYQNLADGDHMTTEGFAQLVETIMFGSMRGTPRSVAGHVELPWESPVSNGEYTPETLRESKPD